MPLKKRRMCIMQWTLYFELNGKHVRVISDDPTRVFGCVSAYVATDRLVSLQLSHICFTVA